MTGPELKTIRNTLGLSQPQFAIALGMKGKNADRTVRSWEQERYDIPGPVQIAATCLLNHKQERK